MKPKRRERREERDPLDRLLFGARDEHRDDRADRRDEDHEGQRPGVEPGMHRADSPRLGGDPEDDGEQHDGDDEHECVELQATGLDLAHLAAGLAGDGRDAVDETVDALLVDVVVREPPERDRAPARCS